MIGTDSGNILPDSIKTAPELLSEQGYYTIGVSENGYAGEAKGLDVRFDDFTKSSLSSIRDALSLDFIPALTKYLLSLRSHGPGFNLDKSAHAQQNSFYTTDITKRKLKTASKHDKPFFCYVHYNDPHHPYLPPLSYIDEYLNEIEASAEDAMAFAQKMHDELYPLMAEGLPIAKDQWEMLHAMYDATIKYTDACVGKLYDLVTNQIKRDTIVVITADHGDLFGEYGLLGHHMVLHDGLIHVPLVTHGLEGVEDHTQKPTQHIDIMQTLISIAGADTSQFQGYDLQTETRTKAISQDLRGTVDDAKAQNYERIVQYNPDVDLSHLPKSMVTAVRTTDLKLVQTDEWTRLYALPNETEEVSKEYSDQFVELQSFTQQWLQTEGEPLDTTSEKPELSSDTEQHLREMGYLE